MNGGQDLLGQIIHRLAAGNAPAPVWSAPAEPARRAAGASGLSGGGRRRRFGYQRSVKL